MRTDDSPVRQVRKQLKAQTCAAAWFWFGGTVPSGSLTFLSLILPDKWESVSAPLATCGCRRQTRLTRGKNRLLHIYLFIDLNNNNNAVY